MRLFTARQALTSDTTKRLQIDQYERRLNHHRKTFSSTSVHSMVLRFFAVSLAHLRPASVRELGKS